MNDRIEIMGLRLVAIHGVLQHERMAAQPFELDLDLELDTTVSARTDELDDTADYARAVEIASGIVNARRHALLEWLA